MYSSVQAKKVNVAGCEKSQQDEGCRQNHDACYSSSRCAINLTIISLRLQKHTQKRTRVNT